MHLRRAIAALCTTTLTASVLIATSTAPATAASPAPVSPATLPALTQSLQMFQGLAESTANQSAQLSAVGMPDIFGWEMAAIGIAGSAQSAQQTVQQLTVIEDQITGIQNTLTTIDGQISALQTQISDLAKQTAYADCSVETGAMNTAVDNMQTVYTHFTQQTNQAAAAANGSGDGPTWQMTVNWARTAVSGPGSIPVALHTINNVLLGTVDDGSISACARALLPKAGTSTFGWEEDYYSQVYNYITYWYQQQVMGLNLYVQALHILAVQASGNPSQYPVDDPSLACQPPFANGDMVTACNLAADAVADLVDAITAQFIAAGAPYSWGTGGQVFAENPAAGQPYAWLMDLNDFQTDGCTLPLSSSGTPCGGSVGTSSQFANSTWGDFTWGDYTGWVPANTVAWQSIGIQPATTTNVPVWQMLQQAGLGDTTWPNHAGLGNLIIYTGEVANAVTVDVFYMGSTSVEGQCFLDTASNISGGQQVYSGLSYPTVYTWNIPACDSVEKAGSLISFVAFNATGAYWTQWPNGSTPQDPTFWRTSPIVYSNPGFYNASFYWPVSGSQWTAQTAPGWVTSVNGTAFTATPQFRWPVLPLADAMCTVKSPAGATMTTTNAAGAYTMCGADMTGWMAAQLPDMPTPAAPIAVSASPQLRSAVVSWQPGTVRQKPVGYRIRGKRGDGPWRTLVGDTSAKSLGQAVGTRLRYPVPVAKSGFWRFKVVALMKDRRSRPSAPTRREYISTQRLASRYYVFTRGEQRRTAKAFSDGRVYFVGRRQSGFGIKHSGVIRGHTARDPYRWSGRWRQPAKGTWKSLQWQGWQRTDGPQRDRKGLPPSAKKLPRY